MIISGTGHRPNKLFKSNYYSLENRIKLKEFAKDKICEIRPRVTLVISGMAQGWDWALAEAAVELNIPFDAYIPFTGQESRWPKHTQEEYRNLLDKARNIKNIGGEGYAVYKMQNRNIAMVDDCESVLALWNGTKGGTGNCIDYAKSINKDIINIWDDWNEIL